MRAANTHASLAALVLISASAPSALAGGGGFIDTDPDRPGRQTVSWAEPSTINVYLPPGLTDPARAAFIQGVQAWTAVMPRIAVTFQNGPPPANAPNAVTVTLTPQPAGAPLSNGGPIFAPVPAGQDHASSISGGAIEIDPTALLNAVFMRNLGTHEFGHVLGLDDCPVEDPRANAMDPSFRLIYDDAGTLIGASPYVPISALDRTTAGLHYTVPTPSALPVLALSGLIASRRRRA